MLMKSRVDGKWNRPASRQFPSEREFADQRRTLVEVAVSYPTGADQKIYDSGPAEPCRTIGPGAEVNLLIALKVCSAQLLAMPSYCKVCSPVQPKTNEQAGRALRFAYFRELLTVSNTISRSPVTAMPTSADWGVPEAPMLESTPSFDCAMKAKRSARFT